MVKAIGMPTRSCSKGCCFDAGIVGCFEHIGCSAAKLTFGICSVSALGYSCFCLATIH